MYQLATIYLRSLYREKAVGDSRRSVEPKVYVGISVSRKMFSKTRRYTTTAPSEAVLPF